MLAAIQLLLLYHTPSTPVVVPQERHDKAWLQDAPELFIDADIPTCKARIKARVERPQTLDNRYISDLIFEAYYQRDHRQYIPEVALQLNRQFGVPLEHIQVIHNESEISVQQFYQAVASYSSEALKLRV